MSTDRDRSALVCALTTTPPGVPSKRHTCDLCRRDVWVSNTMWPRILADNIQVICEGCAPEVMAADLNREVRVAPETVDELRKIGLYGFSKKLVKSLNKVRKRGLKQQKRQQHPINPLFRRK
jgi:hypothetical protein